MLEKVEKDIMAFLHQLDEEENFFTDVEGINKYNIDAMIELIQYNNIKRFGDPIFSRQEIRQGLKKYGEFYFNN